MLSVGGLAGPLGRAALFVGLIGAFFGMVAAITGTHNEDEKVLRLLPRFAYLAMFGAIGAFVCMEWAMITRDFLEYACDVQLHCRMECARGIHSHVDFGSRVFNRRHRI